MSCSASAAAGHLQAAATGCKVRQTRQHSSQQLEGAAGLLTAAPQSDSRMQGAVHCAAAGQGTRQAGGAGGGACCHATAANCALWPGAHQRGRSQVRSLGAGVGQAKRAVLSVHVAAPPSGSAACLRHCACHSTSCCTPTSAAGGGSAGACLLGNLQQGNLLGGFLACSPSMCLYSQSVRVDVFACQPARRLQLQLE